VASVELHATIVTMECGDLLLTCDLECGMLWLVNGDLWLQDIGDLSATNEYCELQFPSLKKSDPYNYIQGCLDGSKMIHLVTDHLLHDATLSSLLSRVHLSLIACDSFECIASSGNPFCLYSCFPIPKWADLCCSELQYSTKKRVEFV
jgi:hypothetical protein